MPQLAAAKKALRQNARRRVINDRWRKMLSSSLRTIKLALRDKNNEQASKNITSVQSTLDRAARHHIIHPNKAARLKSNFTKQINQLGH